MALHAASAPEVIHDRSSSNWNCRRIGGNSACLAPCMIDSMNCTRPSGPGRQATPRLERRVEAAALAEARGHAFADAALRAELATKNPEVDERAYSGLHAAGGRFATAPGNICEYCHLPQLLQEAAFHIDHISPRSGKGPSHADNLALACVTCSLKKAARTRARDALPAPHPHKT